MIGSTFYYVTSVRWEAVHPSGLYLQPDIERGLVAILPFVQLDSVSSHAADVGIAWSGWDLWTRAV